MKLPNGHLAVIEREKLTDYILNPAHPDNGGKADFFQAQGFSRDAWQTLAGSLRKLAATGDVTEAVESAHGQKYILEARIETPSGKRPIVRTVWIVDRGLDAPRLVTAYPCEE